MELTTIDFKEKEPSNAYSFNVGGTRMKIAKEVLATFPNSTMARCLHYEDIDDATQPNTAEYFLDLDPSWVAPVLSSMMRCFSNRNFLLQPLYHTVVDIQSDDELGCQLAIEIFGLEKYFSIVEQYKKVISHSIELYYEEKFEGISSSRNWHPSWKLELHITNTTASYEIPRWSSKHVFLFRDDGNQVFAFLNWNGIESGGKFNKGLLVGLSDLEHPVVNEATLFQTSRNSMTFRALSQDYVILIPQSCHATIQYDHPKDILSYYKSKFKVNFKEMIIWTLDFNDTQRVLSEGSQFVSLHDNPVNHANVEKIDIFQDILDEDISNVINIAFKDDSRVITTRRSIFLHCKGTPLHAKYASTEWEESLNKEIVENGCIVEDHSFECFRKLVNVMRVRNIVRSSNYHGNLADYKPKQVSTHMNSEMQRMLQYFLIDEDDFYGLYNGRK